MYTYEELIPKIKILIYLMEDVYLGQLPESNEPEFDLSQDYSQSESEEEEPIEIELSDIHSEEEG